MSKSSNFKELLDKTYSWPALYTFKFILPTGREKELDPLLEGADISFKNSSGGKYVSVTAKKMMNSSDEVINIYTNASKIKNLIAL